MELIGNAAAQLAVFRGDVTDGQRRNDVIRGQSGRHLRQALQGKCEVRTVPPRRGHRIPDCRVCIGGAKLRLPPFPAMPLPCTRRHFLATTALLPAVLAATTPPDRPPPACPLGSDWEFMPRFGDEFAGPGLDDTKWWDFNPAWHGRKPAHFSRANVRVADGTRQRARRRRHAATHGACLGTRGRLGGGSRARIRPVHNGHSEEQTTDPLRVFRSPLPLDAGQCLQRLLALRSTERNREVEGEGRGGFGFGCRHQGHRRQFRATGQRRRSC